MRARTGRGSLLGFAAIVSTVILTLPALGQPPPGYYASVDTTSAATLRATLHAVIDDHIRFDYTSDNTDTWDILELADEDPANPANILDLYKNASYPKAGGGNVNYQREHAWPNSYGFPDPLVSNYPYTDCHALFLANGSYNGSRRRMPYRYYGPTCTELPTDENNGHKKSPGTGYPGWSNWRAGAPASNTGS